MKRLNPTPNPELSRELQQVVEPLASYICATERPRRSLRLALAALSLEIDKTNRLAASQAAAFLKARFAAPA